MLHFFSLWVVRRYNSSLWGKLYSEWHLTLHRRGAVCCDIALLPPCWLCDIFVGFRADSGDLRNQSVPSEAHKALFCFTLRCLLPPPQRHYAANTSNYKELCGTCGREQTKKTLTGMCVCWPNLHPWGDSHTKPLLPFEGYKSKKPCKLLKVSSAL